MPGSNFKYLKVCVVCKELFYSNRVHSKTCSQRCRNTVFKINTSNLNYLRNNPHVFKASKDQLASTSKLVQSANMKDNQTRQMLFFDGFIDLTGSYKRVLFISYEGKYIEVWNDESDVIVKEFIFFD